MLRTIPLAGQARPARFPGRCAYRMAVPIRAADSGGRVGLGKDSGLLCTLGCDAIQLSGCSQRVARRSRGPRPVRAAGLGAFSAPSGRSVSGVTPVASGEDNSKKIASSEDRVPLLPL
jgi:hypothetical protein